jgi:hypothetical protein
MQILFQNPVWRFRKDAPNAQWTRRWCLIFRAVDLSTMYID